MGDGKAQVDGEEISDRLGEPKMMLDDEKTTGGACGAIGITDATCARRLKTRSGSAVDAAKPMPEPEAERRRPMRGDVCLDGRHERAEPDRQPETVAAVRQRAAALAPLRTPYLEPCAFLAASSE